MQDGLGRIARVMRGKLQLKQVLARANKGGGDRQRRIDRPRPFQRGLCARSALAPDSGAVPARLGRIESGQIEGERRRHAAVWDVKDYAKGPGTVRQGQPTEIDRNELAPGRHGRGGDRNGGSRGTFQQRRNQQQGEGRNVGEYALRNPDHAAELLVGDHLKRKGVHLTYRH